MPRIGDIDRDKSDPFWIGYAMGLVVGEGSFTGDGQTPAMSMALHTSDPLPLVALCRLFGGRLYGPYVYGIRTKRLYLLRYDDLLYALPIFDRHLPASRKREQFEAWLDEYDLRGVLQRLEVSVADG